MRQKISTPWRARLAAAVIDQTPAWGVMTFTKLLGRAARLRLPAPVAKATMNAYIRYFDVNMEDIDSSSRELAYPTFDAFFTRQLRSGIRPIMRERSAIISPCDGQLRSVLTIDSARPILAKDHAFHISELLVDEALAKRFDGGTATTIYLHPRDYHRVHSPCDAVVSSVVTVPGRLLPVTEAALHRQPRLFAQNERMIHVLETMYGAMAVVMVGAFGVGHMSCSYRTCSSHPKTIIWNHFGTGVHVLKGDELGVFHLGSTVILITERGVQPVLNDWPAPVLLGQEILRGSELHGVADNA